MSTKAGTVKAPSTDPGQPDSRGMKILYEIHFSACVEKV